MTNNETRAIFKRVGALALEASQLGREAFLQAHPEPMVLVFTHEPDDDSEHAAFQTLASTISNAGSPIAGMVSLDTPVWRVRKLTGSFPDKIMVGRAPNTDIVIIDPGVSKLHGWFAKTDAGYTYQDAGSRNGSLVADQPVGSMEAVPVTDGTPVRLGPSVELLFFDPETIWSMCRRLTP